MGNVQFWGGPITENWNKNQIELQNQILDRMRDFGMTPVLPAFSGRVVPAFNRYFLLRMFSFRILIKLL